MKWTISFGSLLVVALIGLLLGVIILCIAGLVEGEKKWERFKVAHNCKVVAKVRGDVFNTYSVGANGQMQIGIASTADKTGWACDDGVTYYR